MTTYFFCSVCIIWGHMHRFFVIEHAVSSLRWRTHVFCRRPNVNEGVKIKGRNIYTILKIMVLFITTQKAN